MVVKAGVEVAKRQKAKALLQTRDCVAPHGHSPASGCNHFSSFFPIIFAFWNSWIWMSSWWFQILEVFLRNFNWVRLCPSNYIQSYFVNDSEIFSLYFTLETHSIDPLETHARPKRINSVTVFSLSLMLHSCLITCLSAWLAAHRLLGAVRPLDAASYLLRLVPVFPCLLVWPRTNPRHPSSSWSPRSLPDETAWRQMLLLNWGLDASSQVPPNLLWSDLGNRGLESVCIKPTWALCPVPG